MGTYHYQAKKGAGESATGVIEADSRLEALDKLATKGLFPLEIEEFQESGKSRWFLLKTVSKKDIGFFTRQLADLLESNVPLLRALDLTQEQTDNATLRRLIQAVIDQIRGGKSFSEALRLYPDVFSPLYIHLVYAGEVGGMLSASMSRLAAFMDQEEEFRSRLIAALAYPLFIVLVGGLTIVFLMIFVVPRLTAMFMDSGQGLPWIARLLSWISGFMSSWVGAFVFALLLTAAVAAVVRAPKKTRDFLARTLFKIPVWGSVIQKSMLARFTKTLAMLLTGGVPLLRALDVVAYVLDHPAFHDQVRNVAIDVEQGRSFAESIKRTKLFPVFVCQMIAVGEEANTLEKSLERVALTYERETDRAMKLATSLLEPVMILGVGSIIGVIVIGMLLPIFQISTFMK